MDLGVASIQRYDSHSTLEWFAYYLINGVDKFIIYNHNMPGADPDPAVDIWKKLSKHYDIQYGQCSGYDFYPKIYQEIMDGPRNELDWLIWADADEFYYPVKYRTIKETLAKYNNCPISALGVYWVNFGSSGLEKEPEFITQGFTYRSNFSNPVNHHMKPIIKGKHAGEVRVTNPHVYTTQYGTFSMEGSPILPHCGLNLKDNGCDGNVTHDIMRINHYYSRSLEYFKNVKQKRGPGDRPPEAPGGTITEEWYRATDYNYVEDTDLWDNFGQDIKNKVEELKGLL